MRIERVNCVILRIHYFRMSITEIMGKNVSWVVSCYIRLINPSGIRSIVRGSSTISPNSFISPWNTENNNPNKNVVNEFQKEIEYKISSILDSNQNIQHKLEEKLLQLQQELNTIKNELKIESISQPENSSTQLIDLLVKIKELEGRLGLKQKSKRRKSKRGKTLKNRKKSFNRPWKKWIDYKTYKIIIEKKLINCDKLKKVSRINIR